MTIPSAKRKNIHEHLWLIYDPQKVIHAKKIYDSFMLIDDPKKKVIHAKKNL